jgi:hypothetical protein
MRTRDDVAVAALEQRTDDSRADHAAVTGYIDALSRIVCYLVHIVSDMVEGLF